MNRYLYITFALFVILTGHTASALVLPESDPVPGGIAVISLGPVQDNTRPQASFAEKPVMVVQQDNRWHAIIGIPLNSTPGKKTLWVKARQQRRIEFKVTGKEYEAQYLTLKNKRKVNPEQRDLNRIQAESKRMRSAFNHFDTNIPLDKLQFSLPVNGIISSQFGLRRYFNQQARKPHSGLDIAADTGTTIHTPLAGKVVVIGDFFFNGNTVMIDHGQGLISMYCHLDKIDAVYGATLQQGDTIGHVGMTGRVTGPHLHWSISLNNARIDPVLLLDTASLLTLKTQKK